MCMYDYDSNVIWSHPIKSQESPDLIIGINACYKVLEDANITLIIHCLDNKKFDNIIQVIKKNVLKHQITTSHDHRQLPVERAISTWKYHCTSCLHGADKHFPVYLWCCNRNGWWCCCCCDSTGNTMTTIFVGGDGDPWLSGTTKVGSWGRRSICYNWYYNIRLIYYYFTLLLPPNDSGSDKSTPSWRARLPSIHLVGVDCGVLVAKGLVGASTTVVGWIDTVGPTTELVLEIRSSWYLLSFGISVLFLSGLRTREGYETNNEEKRKKEI